MQCAFDVSEVLRIGYPVQVFVTQPVKSMLVWIWIDEGPRRKRVDAKTLWWMTVPSWTTRAQTPTKVKACVQAGFV